MNSRAPHSLLVRELAERIGGVVTQGDGGRRVEGLRQDSRSVVRGEMFAVRPGQQVDGAQFIPDALARGAAALLVSRGVLHGAPVDVPVIEVEDVGRSLGVAAAEVYGHPTRELRTVGITGTNGKTTTSTIVFEALERLGSRPALIGTLGNRFGATSSAGSHTTPEADDIQRFAAGVVAAGGTHLVMEVSSHALALGRADAIHFAVAAFTNLTQDHLDFHKTMSAYGDAKRRLFSDLAPEASVINVDDPFGALLAAEALGRVTRVSTSGHATSDVRVTRPSLAASGIRATIVVPSGSVEIDSMLVGAHNLANLALALGILLALRVAPADAARALSGPARVPGRLERCDEPGDDVIVLVDYAHTPDALIRALDAVREIARARVLCVFGCGGDRDPTKRAPMGRAVADRADIAVVTNDNPRTEDPATILQMIVAGMQSMRGERIVEPDRATAIRLAVESADSGDIVLIAGKGHEDYQILGTTKHPFSDQAHARAALASRRARAHEGPRG